MSQESNTPSGSDKLSADDIATPLIEIDPGLLSPHQRSLYWDTIGLLGAIDEGILKSGGSSRIFSNLVEIVSLFDENETTFQLIKTFHNAILRCAEEGYSIDGESPIRQQDRKWTSQR